MWSLSVCTCWFYIRSLTPWIFYTANFCIIATWTDFPWSILYTCMWPFHFSKSLLPVRTKQINGNIVSVHYTACTCMTSCCLLLTWKHHREFLRKGCSHKLTFFQPEIWTVKKTHVFLWAIIRLKFTEHFTSRFCIRDLTSGKSVKFDLPNYFSL